MSAILSLVFGWILKFASSGVLDRILSHMQHKTDVNAQLVSEAIRAEMASREVAKEIRLATAGFWEMRLLTFIIGACFVTHLLLVTIDTITTGTRFEVPGWNVPAFPAPLNEWQGAIILSFFGLFGGVRVANGILAIILQYVKGR